MNELELRNADLIPGKSYRNDKSHPNTLNALLKTKSNYSSAGSNGGFRMLNVDGNFATAEKKHAFLALVDSDDSRKPSEWKNNVSDGILTYFGDNDKRERSVQASKGNQYLLDIYDEHRLSSNNVYPIFLFDSIGDRIVRFIGTCYPLQNGLIRTHENGVDNLKAYFYVDQKTTITSGW